MAKKKTKPKPKLTRQAPKKTSTKPSVKRSARKPTKAQKKALIQQKRTDTLNKKKRSLYYQINKKEKAGRKLKRAGDESGLDKISNEIIHLKAQADRTRQQLGMSPRYGYDAKKLKAIAKESQRKRDEALPSDEWREHPSGSFPGWDIPEQIDEDLKRGDEIEWFIIDGKKYPAGDRAAIKLAGLELKKEGGSKKVFTIEYNLNKKTVRYYKN